MASTEFESNFEACEAEEAEREAAYRPVQRSPMQLNTDLVLRREGHSTPLLRVQSLQTIKPAPTKH